VDKPSATFLLNADTGKPHLKRQPKQFVSVVTLNSDISSATSGVRSGDFFLDLHRM
jgi:hypothetical protein